MSNMSSVFRMRFIHICISVSYHCEKLHKRWIQLCKSGFMLATSHLSKDDNLWGLLSRGINNPRIIIPLRERNRRRIFTCVIQESTGLAYHYCQFIIQNASSISTYVMHTYTSNVCLATFSKILFICVLYWILPPPLPPRLLSRLARANYSIFFF